MDVWGGLQDSPESDRTMHWLGHVRREIQRAVLRTVVEMERNETCETRWTTENMKRNIDTRLGDVGNTGKIKTEQDVTVWKWENTERQRAVLSLEEEMEVSVEVE